MVLFNYSTKEITAKIVYYGPGLCGKTTNLQFIYDNLPQTINKGKMLSLATKTDRTLFFDFLPIDLGTIRGMRTRLQLYTVPGQVFYNTTRKLVLKGADGVVFVADSQKRMLEANLESFGNLEENLAEHDMKLAEMPMILQFNKRDLPDVAGIEELNAAINKYNAPIYEAVAPTGIGVHETLKAITRLVLNSLKERYADKREQKADAQAKAAAVMAATAKRAPTAAVHPPATAPPPAFESSPEPVQPHKDAPGAAPVAVAANLPEFASYSSSPAGMRAAQEPLLPPASAEPASLSFDLSGLEEAPEMDALPSLDEVAEQDFRPAGTEPPDFDQTADEPLELTGESDLLEVLPEVDMALEGGDEEELLELADEPLASLAHLEDSMAMPLLDVTSEFALPEESGSIPALAPEEEPVAIPVSFGAAAGVEEEQDSPGNGFDMDFEPTRPADSASEPASLELDAFDEPSFEPVDDSPIVLEDLHDFPSGVEDLAALTEAAPNPLADEPQVPLHLDDSPRVPKQSLVASPSSDVRDVSCSPVTAQEISVPVKLEIGGQCISFELKISLDLTGAFHAGVKSQEAQEIR